METAENKNKLNDFSFYLLMGILAFTVLVTLGYLVYSLLFA